MKRFFTLILLLTVAMYVQAQDYIQVSTGAAYSQQAYYTLSDDNTTTIDNDSWDIAFSTAPFSAGVMINESATFGEASNRLWVSSIADFEEVTSVDVIADSLYNTELDWTSGAFNAIADATNPLDYGWGSYNPANHQVIGTRVFVMQLRDGGYKKVFVESVIGGVYTVKIANLDGSEEVTFTVDQADYAGKPFAVYTIATNEVSAPVDAFDMAFMRYSTPLNAGGETVEYNVTGVLTGPGVEVVKASGVADPQNLGYEDYIEDMTTEANVIGHDWKTFDFGTFGWLIAEDRAYFVKTSNNDIWRVVFYDFEGSSTGTSTFIKWNLGSITSTTNATVAATSLKVFPNPTVDYAELAFVMEQGANIDFTIINTLGQAVMDFEYTATAGLNATTIDVAHLPAGSYRIVGKINQTGVVTSTLIITH